MVNPTLNAVSLCAGYGGLDEGFHAAAEHLGFAARTVAYVEWEAYAAALLLTRMEDKALAPAPIWCGDLGRLDGHDFRGRVDAVLAGFPCQPHSMAGARKGIEDDRWIWPAIARFIGDSGAWLVVCENVAGLLSSGGLAPVLADLAAMGFRVEYGVLSAASVGASHKRDRVFIVAYLPSERRGQGFSEQQGQQREPAPDEFGGAMADPDLNGHGGPRLPVAGRCEVKGAVGTMDNPASTRRIPARIRPEANSSSGERLFGAGLDAMAHPESQRLGEARRDCERPEERRGGAGDELADAGRELGQAALKQSGDGASPQGFGQTDQLGMCGRNDALADARQPEREGRELGTALHGNGGGAEAHGSVSEFRGPFFAPGPADPRWPAILERWPYLAPALEPGVRFLADGDAVVVGKSRPNQLRAAGNGVVALQAATAIVGLMRRLGVGV